MPAASDDVVAGATETSDATPPAGPVDLGDRVGLFVERVADVGLTAYELDEVDAVVTTATVGIAVTGTIVLDHGPGQGRRALSLVPDRHVCVVTSDQVVPTYPTVYASSTRCVRSPGSADPAPPVTSSSTASKVSTAHATCTSSSSTSADRDRTRS